MNAVKFPFMYHRHVSGTLIKSILNFCLHKCLYHLYLSSSEEKGLAMSTDKTGQCVLPEQRMQKEPQGLHTTTGVRGDSRDHVIHSWQKLPSCVSHTLMKDKLAPTWQIIKQHNNEQCYMQVDLHQWDHESAGSNKKLRIALSVCPVPEGDGV